jgi:hypothetical protein
MGYADELNLKDRDVLNRMIDSFVHLNQNDIIYEKGAASPPPTSPSPTSPTSPSPTSPTSYPRYSRLLTLRRSQSSPLGGGSKSKSKSKKEKKKRGNTKPSRQRSRKNRNRNRNKNKRNRL